MKRRAEQKNLLRLAFCWGIPDYTWLLGEVKMTFLLIN
jgi:hypothetical protein